jgi:hypothetical protein
VSAVLGDRLRRALVGDGSLQLDVQSELEPLVRRWLPAEAPGEPPDGLPRVRPSSPSPGTSTFGGGARIRVGRARPEDRDRSAPTGDPVLRLGTVGAWPATGGPDGFELHGGAGTSGVIDLGRARADLRVPDRHDPAAAGWDLYSMLTLSAALLLCGMRRALVHAGAVVAPDDSAWLLVGDARSGKSSTAATLIGAGWDFLSDDQVVADWADPDGPPRLEGWLRPFHLDAGWEAGRPGGARRGVDPATLGPGRPRAQARAAGLLFPVVAPGPPTGLERITGGEALSLLLRQTPWLFAVPRDAASDMLHRLRQVCRLPAYRLHLGIDTFGHGPRLVDVLTPAVARP